MERRAWAADFLGPRARSQRRHRVRRVRVGSFDEEARPRAAQRIAWEVRKRTSIETTLEPTVTRFDDPSIFRTPLLYWPRTARSSR